MKSLSSDFPTERFPSQILFLISVFVVALIVRLIFVHFFSIELVNDLLWNDAVGWNLANGNGYTASQTQPFVPGIFRTPGYPFFLALVYFFCGHSVTAVYIVQAVLDSFSSLLLFGLAQSYVHRRIARFTAILYALYPYPAIFCGVLHQDILLIFATLLSLIVLTRSVKRPESRWYWLLVGVSVGFTALIKANFVLFLMVPFGTLLFLGIANRQKPGILALITIGFVLALFPWVLRNYLVFHGFPPLATGGAGIGLMLVQEELKGEDPLLKRSHDAPIRDLKDFTDGAESIMLEKARARKAIPVLREHWRQYLLVMAKHIPRLWLSKYSVWHGYFVRLSGIIISWVVLILGLAGMFLLRRQWLRMLPFYLTIAIITMMQMMYIVEARYTLPARPVMLVFVAYALVSMWDVLQGKRRGSDEQSL